MFNASAQKTLGGGQLANFRGQYVHQLTLGVRTAIGQRALEVIPHALIGVQFGGVHRKGYQMEARGAGEKLLYGVPSVDLAIVQENDQMAGHLAQQMPEKRRCLLPLDVALIQLAVQRTVEAAETDGDAGDSRDVISDNHFSRLTTIKIPDSGAGRVDYPGIPTRRAGWFKIVRSGDCSC